MIRAGGSDVDMLLEPKKKVASTFDYANRIGARYIVFVAPQEWENDMVRIKDLRADYTDKDEEKQLDVKLSDLGRVSEVLAAHAAARKYAGEDVDVVSDQTVSFPSQIPKYHPITDETLTNYPPIGSS